MTHSPDQEPRISVTTLAASTEKHLTGNMGTVQLILTVLAVSAPLAAVAGVVPVVIANGNGVGAPGTYVLVGAILLLFAVGFTTMSRHLHRGGAFYAYITAGLGRPTGLGSAFIAMLGYLTLMIGAYAMLGASIDNLLVFMFGLQSVPWWIYSLFCWLVVSVLGHMNIEVSGRVLAILMIIEVVIVLALDLPVLFGGGPEGWAPESFTPAAFTSGSVGLGILFASSTFLGFEATAIYRSEVRDPDKTIPRATYLSISLIALFYVLSSWALIAAVGPSQAVEKAQSGMSTMFATAIGNYLGAFATDTVTVFLITSVFASVLSSHNPIARYQFSLARDGVLPTALGRVSKKHGSPSAASLSTSVAALIVSIPFVMSGLDVVSFYSWMFGIGAFALLILMALTCLSVIAFFRRNRKNERFWNTAAAPGLGLLGLLVMIVIVSGNFTLLIGGSEVLGAVFQGLIYGLGILGVVLAVIWSRTRPHVYARIGGLGEEEPLVPADREDEDAAHV